jgi:malate dehydrogenase
VASRDVKVLVVGNPANTNAYIAMKSAPDLPRATSPPCCAWTTTARSARSPPRPASRWRHREAGRVGQPLADHVRRLPLRHHRRRKSVKDMINDEAWNRDTFLPTVGKRGAAIIEARGLSSAASAANAAIDHMRDWALGTGASG